MTTNDVLIKCAELRAEWLEECAKITEKDCDMTWYKAHIAEVKYKDMCEFYVRLILKGE